MAGINEFPDDRETIEVTMIDANCERPVACARIIPRSREVVSLR